MKRSTFIRIQFNAVYLMHFFQKFLIYTSMYWILKLEHFPDWLVSTDPEKAKGEGNVYWKEQYSVN